jgi:hypothetical protein
MRLHVKTVRATGDVPAAPERCIQGGPAMPTKTIQESAAATLKRLEENDRGLGSMLKKAYGYAVFPAVGKASLVVGGAYGRGAVFEKGKFIGYATLSQLTLGVQLGGDTFTEVLVFKDKGALDQLKKGKMAFAANASAVLVKAGKAAAKGFPNGVTALTYTRGGELLELAIGGQKFSFKPADEEMEDQGEEEGEEQEQPARGGAKGKVGTSQEEESDEGEEQDEGEGDEGAEAEDSGEGEESGVFGRALGGVKSAASGVADTARAHPVAATVVGTALVATAAFFVVRAMRNRSDQDEQGQEDQKDAEAQDQADEGEEEQDEGDEEENDKGDTLNQLRRRRSRA